MNPFKLINFFDAELLVQIDSSGQELALAPELLDKFDTTQFTYVIILTDGLVEPEIVWVVGKTFTTLTVLRGQEGTTA